MKKIFIGMVTLLLGVILMSCGEKKYAHVFVYKNSDQYVGSLTSQLTDKLTEKGISWQKHDGDGDQAKQNGQIDTAITQKVGILIVNLVNSETAPTILEKAKKANIPVIFFNRQPKDREFMKTWDKAVMLDGEVDTSSKMQGKLVAEYLLKDYDKYAKADGIINYVMVMGEAEHEAAKSRTTHSVGEANRLLVAAGKPEMKQIGENLVSNWQAAQAKTLMDTLLTNHAPETIDLIICNNDDAASGVIGSLEAKGYNKGYGEDKKLPEKTIPVFGYDAIQLGKDLIAAGKMAGTIKQPAEENVRIIMILVENYKNNKAWLDGATDLKFVNGYNCIMIYDEIYKP